MNSDYSDKFEASIRESLYPELEQDARDFIRHISFKYRLTFKEIGKLIGAARDLDMWDDGYPGLDPTDFVWWFYSSAAMPEEDGYNVGRWTNEDFDAWMDEAYTLDEEYRKEVFCEMAIILEEELPWILLFSTLEMHGISARLDGVQPSVNDPLTWNVYDWTLTE